VQVEEGERVGRTSTVVEAVDEVVVSEVVVSEDPTVVGEVVSEDLAAVSEVVGGRGGGGGAGTRRGPGGDRGGVEANLAWRLVVQAWRRAVEERARGWWGNDSS
jgi:hypothetical protein